MITHIFGGAARKGGNLGFVIILGHFIRLYVFQNGVTSDDGCTLGIVVSTFGAALVAPDVLLCPLPFFFMFFDLMSPANVRGLLFFNTFVESSCRGSGPSFVC